MGYEIADKRVYHYGEIITDPTKISRSSVTTVYDVNGNVLQKSTLTYDVVVGAYVVGRKE